MRDRSRISKNFPHLFFFAHRATAAFRALCARCFAESFRARAFPPFKPPSLPSATAAAFFVVLAISDSWHNAAPLESRLSLRNGTCPPAHSVEVHAAYCPCEAVTAR